MKETIVSILQQRMDKCTSDQFWAVGFLTGLNAFVILQKRTNALASVPCWAILLGTTVFTVYGAYYIIACHRNFYLYRSEQAKLLRVEPYVPDFLKRCPSPRELSSLRGVGLYVLWISLMWLATLITYLL